MSLQKMLRNDKSKYREMTKDEFKKFIDWNFVDEEDFVYQIQHVSDHHVRTTDGLRFTFKEMLNNIWLKNYETCGMPL